MSPRSREASLRAGLLLTPLCVALHNLEEYPAIVDYAHRHLRARIVGRGAWPPFSLPLTLPLPTRAQFGVAVALATALPVPLVAVAAAGLRRPRRLGLGLALHAALAANALSHVAQTALFGERSPGTATAVALFAPHAVWVYALALRGGFVTGRQALAAAAVGLLGMPPAALALQTAGALLAKGR